MTTRLVRDVIDYRRRQSSERRLEAQDAFFELEDLEARTAAGILGPPPPSRAERLAQFINWLLFWRWPGAR